MPKRILLLSTNRCTIPEPVFPLGLSYINAALHRAGHDTLWLDYQVQNRPLEDIITTYQPDWVGISLRNIDDVSIRNKETYFDGLAQICGTTHKLSSCPVILGGSGYSVFPAALLEQSGADFGVHGEGERSLVALIDACDRAVSYENIPGLVFRRGNQIIVNPQSHSDNSLPLNAVDCPDELAGYYLKKSGTLNIQTQRGCSHSCCYCTYPLIEGRLHRRRPPELIADDMERIAAAGAKYAFIVDSIFNSSPEHVMETCAAIIARHTGLRWGCFLRPQGLTAEQMKLMVRAGLTHIEFGSDSFSDAVLEAYGKRFTFAEILQSHNLARQEGVETCHFLICGGLGETMETMEETHRNSQRLEGSVIMAFVGMRIYPQTALYRQALAEGVIDPATPLLKPAYYIAPGVDAERLFSLLAEYGHASPNWIVGDPIPEYGTMVQRLRERGIVGPLWSYFSMLQRIQPRNIAAAADLKNPLCS